MLRFNYVYFILTIPLFIAEFVIGMYMHDRFIRPYFGDFLVVILIYCLVKAFFDTPVGFTAITVLLFSYIVETTQYFHLINLLGLARSKAACLILGTHFSFTDMLMYTLGIILVLFAELYMAGDKTLH